MYACHAGLSMSELRLKVKPKPGDREPIPADYESIEDEDEEENFIEADGNCFAFLLCVLTIVKCIFTMFMFVCIVGFALDEDGTVAYQVPAKNINGSR